MNLVTQTRNLRWLAPVLLLLGALTTFALSGALGGSTADAQDGHDHSDLEHADRYTGPGEEAEWPPRPLGAAPLEPADPTTSVASRPGETSLDDGFFIDLTPAAPVSAEITAAIGSDYLLISHTTEQQGKYDYVGPIWTWFSRDNNQTVVAEQKQDGTVVVDVLAASEFQPIISNQEVDQAAALGMIWLLENGFPEAAGLQGTAIRALNHGEFYEVRMAYVTFATDNFADPTHSTLVDLTNGVVVSGREL